MGVRKDDLTQYIQQLETLKADIPAIMSKIAAGEGAYAVKQARLICKMIMLSTPAHTAGTGRAIRLQSAVDAATSSDFTIRWTMPATWSMDFGATLCRATGRAIPLFMAAMIPKAACMSARRADTCGGILC